MLGVRYVSQPGRRGLELRPGAARELTTCPDGPPHRLGDLLERDTEHVVQHERHPLAGTEAPQDLQQGGADLVVEGDPIGRTKILRLVNRSGGLEDSRLAGTFVTDACRPDLVEAQPPRDHRQPATNVVNLRLIGSCQAQERLLGDVFGLADIPDHLIGEIHQVGAVAAPRPGDQVGDRR